MVPPRTFPLWIIFDGGQKSWVAKVLGGKSPGAKARGAKDLGGKRLGGKRPGGKRPRGLKTRGQKSPKMAAVPKMLSLHCVFAHEQVFGCYLLKEFQSEVRRSLEK